jgi:hypothetical protein
MKFNKHSEEALSLLKEVREGNARADHRNNSRWKEFQQGKSMYKKYKGRKQEKHP